MTASLECYSFNPETCHSVVYIRKVTFLLCEHHSFKSWGSSYFPYTVSSKDTSFTCRFPLTKFREAYTCTISFH